tara:strand:- start:126 stop:500 length:375 start_codon:yes stop_codon:yes gene_type:complete
MTYREFVDKYYSVTSFEEIWKEILLIIIINIPFYIYSRIEENNYVYIIPFIVVFIIFSVILSNVDMKEAEQRYKEDPIKNASPGTVKLGLSFICTCIYQILCVAIIQVVVWGIPKFFMLLRILF